MKAAFRSLLLLAAIGTVSLPSSAQDVLGQHIQTDTQRHWYVVGTVKDLRGDPIRGAVVDVIATNVVGGVREMMTTTLQGEFFTELNPLEHLSTLALDLTITKPGFLKGHVITDLRADAEQSWIIPVTLREKNEDPDLLSHADFVASLMPRLKKLPVPDGLSASAEKDYMRGVREFFDQNLPDRALPYFANVVQRDSSCVACRAMLGVAELESGDWGGAKRDLSEASNQSQTDRTKGRPEPMLVLGVMQSWQHEPKEAAGYFVEALKFAPQDPLALQELGRSQLLIQNWPAADENLRKALDAGAGPEARLMRVQALLGEGHAEEANKEMTRYLDGRDVKHMSIRVRQLWAEVQTKKKVEVAYRKADLVNDTPIDYLNRTAPELKELVPATDQAPLAPILSAMGKNVAAYFRNFPNTSSLEEIHQAKLGHNGKIGETLKQKFQYLCLTSSDDSMPHFTEHRVTLAGEERLPQGLQEGFMLTGGFVSTSLVFHPVYQSQSAFRYLGHQKINGRDTLVVAFAQQPAKARWYGSFKTGDVTMPTFSQGLAWIDSSNYQIVRLRTDLLTPLPAVRLERQTTEINYDEVHFKGIAEGFWLPRAVTVTVAWNGRNLRNEHEYSGFKLFNVAASQKTGKPKVEESSKHETGPGEPR